MINKYSSVLRTFYARNILESVISPPLTLSFDNTDFKPQIFRYSIPGESPVSDQSNIAVHRIGVFANFADGLVMASAPSRLNVGIDAVAAIGNTVLTGDNITVTAGAKTLVADVGTGDFTGQLVVGSIIHSLTPGNIDRYFIIDTIIDDDNATLTDYSDYTQSATGVFARVTTTGSAPIYSIDIPVLNYMHEFGQFFKPALFSGIGNVINDILLIARVNTTAYSGTVDFLTKSVSTDFDGDPIFFDCVADVEFTNT